MKRTMLILFFFLIGISCFQNDRSLSTIDLSEKEQFRTVQNLMSSLDSEDSLEVAVAAYQLGKRGPEAKKGVNKLLSLLNDNRDLCYHLDKWGEFMIRTERRDKCTTPGQEAAVAIARIDSNAIFLFRKAYDRNKQNAYITKRNILHGILELEDEYSNENLRRFMNDEYEYPSIRCFIIQNLVTRLDIYDDLVRIIDHPCDRIRRNALLALGLTEHPEGLEYMIEEYGKENAKTDRPSHYLGNLRDRIHLLAKKQFHSFIECQEWWEANQDSIRTIR